MKDNLLFQPVYDEIVYVRECKFFMPGEERDVMVVYTLHDGTRVGVKLGEPEAEDGTA